MPSVVMRIPAGSTQLGLMKVVGQSHQVEFGISVTWKSSQRPLRCAHLQTLHLHPLRSRLIRPRIQMLLYESRIRQNRLKSEDVLRGERLKHLFNAGLEALGAAFVGRRDKPDWTTPAGCLMFQNIGAMAEFECAQIQERVRAGMRNPSDCW
jgi:hypothetical protein